MQTETGVLGTPLVPATETVMITRTATQTDQEDAVTHGASQSVVQVDLFGGEHTAYSRDVKWLANQPQTSIGPKQTAKVQVPDIRVAKCGTNKQAKLKRVCKRLLSSLVCVSLSIWLPKA